MACRYPRFDSKLSSIAALLWSRSGSPSFVFGFFTLAVLLVPCLFIALPPPTRLHKSLRLYEPTRRVFSGRVERRSELAGNGIYQEAPGARSSGPWGLCNVRVTLQEESITANTGGFAAGDAFTVLAIMEQSKCSKLPLWSKKQKAVGLFPASDFAEVF
jgi:hypothetical protein